MIVASRITGFISSIITLILSIVLYSLFWDQLVFWTGIIGSLIFMVASMLSGDIYIEIFLIDIVGAIMMVVNNIIVMTAADVPANSEFVILPFAAISLILTIISVALKFVSMRVFYIKSSK